MSRLTVPGSEGDRIKPPLMGAEENEMLYYEGHGIRVEGDRYPTVRHDLDDAALPMARERASAEITVAIASAAPGAERIGRLTTAHEEIRKLRTQEEVAGDDARKEEAEKVEHEKRVRWVLDRVKKEGIEGIIGVRYGCRKIIDGLPEDPRVRSLIEKAGVEITRLDKIDEERKEEKKRREAEAEKQTQGEIDEWISSHGSSRLVRIQEEGIDYARVYRDERLAVERPGWQWLSCVCGGIGEIRGSTVTDELLSALDVVRKVAPDARLAWLGEGEHVSGCGCSKEEYGDREVTARVVFAAEFLERAILKEVK